MNALEIQTGRDGAVDVVNLRGKADSALPRPAETRVCGRRDDWYLSYL